MRDPRLPEGWHYAILPASRRRLARTLMKRGVPYAAAEPVAARIAADRYSEVELGWIYLLEGTLDTVPDNIIAKWARIGGRDRLRD